MFRRLIVLLALAGTSVTAACSSSGGNSAHIPGSAGGGASGGAQRPAGNAGGGPLDVSKLCKAVPQADVQKLFKATAPPVTVNPAECDWGSGAITVDIYLDDPNRKYLKDLFVSGTTPLPNIGDYAVWNEPVPQHTVPVVGCHNHTTSVTISPGLDVDKTTLTYSGRAPIFTVDQASAAQYAAEEGKLCSDIFAAQG